MPLIISDKYSDNPAAKKIFKYPLFESVNPVIFNYKHKQNSVEWKWEALWYFW